MRTPVRKCTIQSKVSRNFSPDEKKAIIEMWEKEGTSLRQFAETHKMSRTTLRKWVTKKEEYDTSALALVMVVDHRYWTTPVKVTSCSG